ncbi:hypothetical protein M407DRAFT_204978 [Tulasnella calospora MUT 4182]|uniref:Uncharacterized protein n=1 Tax=Tulasnella calospora MUT 4182 TaxID=1051891 RepID=A0A0C3LGR4_9AGAM|nr:hypothetical protein M407DRAFT_204978 [Tulasnella calospora MUT 4182]
MTYYACVCMYADLALEIANYRLEVRKGFGGRDMKFVRYSLLKHVSMWSLCSDLAGRFPSSEPTNFWEVSWA